eukprot:TRINITY_DN116015_c0_g1_i1.p1 TRINITY_DN116015_c0_g1~~TRINITY_DN116015_c0_g1_i1.p1  ORF type:complete len:227 (-),score=33.03 TRINITY_DN116015_c0_g1_i1:29-709(-)
MSGESGWQMRLCAALCAPPIPRLRFTQRTPLTGRELPLLEREAIALFFLGFLRSYLNASAMLGDFMGGGTDLFSALLAFGALYDACAMNGSFLIMFLIWALTNTVLFNVLLSFGSNVAGASEFMSGPTWNVIAFLADNLLILVNSGLQVSMCRRTRSVLDEVMPNWRNQMAWGSGGAPPSASQEPLLGQSAFGARAAQPAGAAFQAFSGSGQRLGGSSNRDDSRRI